MSAWQWEADSGTTGATVKTTDAGGTGGTPFDSVNQPISGSTAYIASPVHSSTHSVAFQTPTSGSAGSAFVQWTTSVGTLTEQYLEFDIYLPSAILPPANCIIIRTRSSGSVVAGARFNITSGAAQLELFDAAFTARYTDTNNFPTDQWVRVGLHVVHSTTAGHLEARIYSGANLDNNTPDYSLGNLTDNWNTGANADSRSFGILTATNNLVAYGDHFRADTVNWPSPNSDTTPPTVPASLRVTGATSTSVSLSWAASADASGVNNYIVYRNGVQVGTPTLTSYSDNGLSPYTTYSYTVAAVDIVGNVSAPCAAVNVTSPKAQMPAERQGLHSSSVLIHAPTTPPHWIGVTPLSVNSPDSTQSFFTSAPGAVSVRSVQAHLNQLFASAAAQVIDTTTGEGLTLENSVADAHANAYKLVIRFRGGQWWPAWTSSDPTHPVVIVSDGTSGTPVAGGQNAVELPWNSNATAGSTAAIQASVDSSNYRYWYQKWFTAIGNWLTGPCPGDPTHPRYAHVLCVPATGPSTVSPEMTIVTATATAIQGNTTPVTGVTDTHTGYQQAWLDAIKDQAALLPAAVHISLSGGFLFANSSDHQQAQVDLLDYAAATYGERFVAMRNDYRESYFTSFGKDSYSNAASNPNSPINFLKRAAGSGCSVALQTAGDTLVLDIHTSDTDAQAVQDYITLFENMLSSISNRFLWVETTTSMMAAPAGGTAAWTAGGQYATSAVGGWPGGTVCISQYLTSATGNFQSRLVGNS